MKFPLYKSQREPGFRLSFGDVVLACSMAGLSFGLARFPELVPIWPLPVHVFLTFFCFCNVFRIGTRQEVAWWCVAALSFWFCFFHGIAPYPLVLYVTVPMAVVSVVWSALRGRYSGVGHSYVAALRMGKPHDARGPSRQPKAPVD